MELTDFLNRLSGVKKVGTGYQALCPAHEDAKASLHVATSARGIGVKCHAGCDTAEVLAELDLQFSDLFAEGPSDKFNAGTNGHTKREIIAEYDYHDEQGTLLYQVVRYEPKEFRQRKPEGAGWSWSVKGVRKVPYMLPEVVNSTGPVFIVEGEKDVHTLRVHGYVATTNAGGAGKWDDSWASIFEGRDVYIIPDSDEAGRQHAERVAESLDSSATVRVIFLFGAKDITEWFLANEADEFVKLVETAPLWTTIKEEQERLDADEAVFVWPDKPTNYGLFGDICRLLDPHTEADPLALYMELMAHFGNAIGPGPHYKIGGTRHRGNLFIAICGQTASARKGSAHDWVVELLRQIDPYYCDTCIIGGLASGEGMIHQVRDPKTKTNKKGEVEVLDDGVTDKRRLFFESELAGRTFVAMKREGSTLSAVMRQAWDCSNLNVATKQNDDRATNPHISVVGHTTLKELLSVIRPEDIAGGTANRFLYFVVERSKEIAVQTEPSEEELRLVATKLRKALEHARKVNRVGLTDDGMKRWQEIYTHLNREMEELDEQTMAFLARGAAQILRLALILCLADSETNISPIHLDQAVALFNYSRSSVEYMLGRNVTGLTQEEERLYAILDKDGPKMTSEVAKVLHWNGAKVKMVAAKLAQRRMLTMTTNKRADGGRGRPAVWLSV